MKSGRPGGLPTASFCDPLIDNMTYITAMLIWLVRTALLAAPRLPQFSYEGSYLSLILEVGPCVFSSIDLQLYP